MCMSKASGRLVRAVRGTSVVSVTEVQTDWQFVGGGGIGARTRTVDSMTLARRIRQVRATVRTPMLGIGWLVAGLTGACNAPLAARTLPVEEGAATLLDRAAWNGTGVLVVGERHGSALSLAVVRLALERSDVDCLWLERNDPLEESIDQHLYGRRREPERLESLWWSARAHSVHVHGIDARPKRLVTTDPVQDLILDRNDRMAERADHLLRSGSCRSAVLLVGSAHLGAVQDPSGDLAASLAALGHQVSTLVLVDDTHDRTTRVNAPIWRDDRAHDRQEACVRREPRWFEPRSLGRSPDEDPCSPGPRLPDFFEDLHRQWPIGGSMLPDPSRE